MLIDHTYCVPYVISDEDEPAVQLNSPGKLYFSLLGFYFLGNYPSSSGVSLESGNQSCGFHETKDCTAG